jgi:hypothetical protein
MAVHSIDRLILSLLVLLIRYSGSRILIFIHPGSRIVIELSKIWFWIRDPGYGIRKKNLFRIADPGDKKGTESRIRIHNTGSFLRTDGRDAVGSAEAVRAARHEAADLRHVQVHLHPLAPRHVLPAGPRDLALLYPGTALFNHSFLIFCLASSKDYMR